MSLVIPPWALPILLSAAFLGVYDFCIKIAVRNNAVVPVVFCSTACGTSFYLLVCLLTGHFLEYATCSFGDWLFLLLKSCLVGSSWFLGYYAIRELPLTVSVPIRAASPLWAVVGGMVCFCEIPNWIQTAGMFLIIAGYCSFSFLGKMGGSAGRHYNKGIVIAILGTILSAASGVMDKYLIGVRHIDRNTVQFWFAVLLVVILGSAWLIRRVSGKKGHDFHWSWAIPAIGILLILSDYLLFKAVSCPDIRISILSLIRRGGCIVTFTMGVVFLREENVVRRACALGVILLGIILLIFE